MLGKTAEGARAQLAEKALDASWAFGDVVATGSESVACKQSALPVALSEKGISPPSCRNSALSAESVTGV
eukprot:1363861-Pleurochrysis_carterae.AAC.1